MTTPLAERRRPPSSSPIASGRTCSAAIPDVDRQAAALCGSHDHRSAASRRVTSIRRMAPIFWFQIPLDPKGVNHSFEGFMRVKPGTTIERARSEMAGVMAGVGARLPGQRASRIYVVRPLVESIVGELGPILIVVLSATGVLLVLACVNVTNLLLARGAARAREMAVRVALGAGRGRIVRQLLTESILLATVGAVLGVFAAYAFVRLLLTMGASQLPRLDAVAVRRPRAAVRAGRTGRQRRAGRLCSGAAAGGRRCQDVDERKRPLADRRARHRPLAQRDDRRRSRAGGHAGRRRGLAGAQLRQPAARPIPGSRPTAAWCSTSRLWGRVSATTPPCMPRSTDLLERLRGLSGVVAAGSTFNFPLRAGPENALFVHFDGRPATRRTTSTRASASSAPASSRRWAFR